MLLNAFRIVVATLVALALFVLAVANVFAGGMRLLVAVLASAVLASLVAVWVARKTRAPAAPLSWPSSLRALRRGAEGTLAVCVAMAVTGFVGNAFLIRPPAEAELAAHFQQHRAEYEALRDMIREDGLVSVQDGGDSFARDSSSYQAPAALGILAERAAAYRRLLGATSGSSVHVWSDGEIAFPVAGWGAANHGWRMALVWSKATPSPLVPSLDGFRKTGRPLDWKRAFSSLGGDWYLTIVW
jgi:hypothetical protein